MTSDDFIKHVKRIASIPTSQVTFQNTDFLDLANGEMQTYLLPWLDKVNEDFFLWDDDQSFVSGAKYRIHTRAIGCTLRDVKFVLDDGTEYSPPRVAFDEHELRFGGYYIRGHHVHVVTPSTSPAKMRLIYAVRPNQMVLLANATTITAKTATTLTLAATPSGFSSPNTFDVINGKEPFDFKEKGIDRAGTVAGGVITLTDGLGTDDFAVGDYVALARQSPVVMLPEPAAWLLVQQCAVRCLEALGDGDGMQAAMASRTLMQKEVADLMKRRVKGDPQKVVSYPTHPLWRSGF